MKKFQNEVYSLVDEEFISKFSKMHSSFIKTQYYDYYVQFCNLRKRKPLSDKEFYTNMHRRRIQLYQLCCPYCGTIELLLHDKRTQGRGGYNYCPNCGRGSAVDNIRNQIYRFIRISNINRIGLKTLKQKYPDKEEWLIGYDCFQMEIIELASIIEVIFREYFEALLYIGNLGVNSPFISKVIRRYTGNDFMNIEKANVNFRKAFGIDIKKQMDVDVWNDLVDIVNLRNMMVHNNGRVDMQFRNTSTFQRVKDKIEGNLYRLEDEDIQKYLVSVVDAVTDISNLFLERFYTERNSVIANHYFNNGISSLAEEI